MSVVFKETKVETLLVNAYHETCGGKFKATGMQLLSMPAQYPHVCIVCGHQETFRGVRYPKTIIREILT